ncbi:MAG: hypothetical protein DRI86_16225 [Bacteroidetes bacterium]|nr:MAG: hypothetical protein DRI86_16225 [Bacteroidota bacterium]
MKIKILLNVLLSILFINSIIAQNPGDLIRYKLINNTNGNIGTTIPNGSLFGTGLCNIGDLNNDGVIDLAVGAPLYNAYGAVFILFMDTNGTVSSTTILTQNQNGISGIDSNGSFGYFITNLKDINNDGINDIAVSELLCSDGGTSTGAVHIITLDTNGHATSQNKISKLSGYGSGGLPLISGKIFGVSVSEIGDLNNDGYTDIIVGNKLDNQTGPSHGAAWILFLNEKHQVGSYKKITKGIPNFDPTFTDNYRFSSTAEGIGDYNNDGFNDVIIGSPNDQDGPGGAGAFYILYLDTGANVLSYSKISNSVVSGSNPFSSNFSTGLSSIPDINGDGLNDFVSGAYRLDGDKGGVHFITLDTNDNVNTHNLINYYDIPALNTSDRFGRTIEYLGDYNNDGRIEVAISAPYNNYNSGNVYILSIHSELSVSIDKTNVLCYGDSTGIAIAKTIDTNPPYTYLWSNGSTNDTISNLPTGTYTVTVTNSLNTTNTSTTVIGQASPMVLNTTSGSSTCFGDSVEISCQASGGLGIKMLHWDNSLLSAESHMVAPFITTTYSVWAKDAFACISDTSFITVDVNLPPTPNLGADTVIFQTQTIVLNAGNYQSYIWNTGATSQSITVDGSNYGYGNQTYFVIVTDTNGCTGNDAITISIINGIENGSKLNPISTYPNPTKDILNIDFNNNIGLTTLEIFDIKGKLLISKKLNPKQEFLSLNIKELPVGSYIIKLSSTTSSTIFTTKILKI